MLGSTVRRRQSRVTYSEEEQRLLECRLKFFFGGIRWNLKEIKKEERDSYIWITGTTSVCISNRPGDYFFCMIYQF